MFKFQIQSDSCVPPSKQLFDQLYFVIASGQYPAGEKLPSTRYLAMITGLHRNTISKVYRQLEEIGLVESLAGSGSYVKVHLNPPSNESSEAIAQQFPQAQALINQSLEQLLTQGCSLIHIKELFLAEIDWRLDCLNQIVVTVPSRDLAAGQLMVRELNQFLGLKFTLICLEELASTLTTTPSAAIVITNRYFTQEVLAVVSNFKVRVIPLDIYDYHQELQLIKELPTGCYLGLVSLSAGTLAVAQTIIHSLRGYDLSILTAQFQDSEQLQKVVQHCHTIISDRSSYPSLKRWISQHQEDQFSLPKLICTQNYIGEQSLAMLRRELGLGIPEVPQ